MAGYTRDQRIIKDNPGKTAHEYRMLGVSEAKVQELIKAEESQVQKPKPIAETPRIKAVVATDPNPARAVPHTRPVINHSVTAILRDKRTGKGQRMSRVRAEKFRDSSKFNRENFEVI